MNYRELLVRSYYAAAICASSLLISGSSFASSVRHDSLSDVGSVMEGSFYVSGSYSPAFPAITSFDVREADKETSYLKSYSKTAAVLDIANHQNFTREGHSFKFAKSLLASFEGATGYAMGGARVEVEASYKRFNSLQDSDYKNTDAANVLALVRSPVITQDNFSVLNLDNLTDISVMLNACYDVLHTDLPVSPYVCAGLGASFIEIANHVTGKFSYKGKVGISYQLTPEISLIAGGFYHGIFDESYESIPVSHRVNIEGDAKAVVKANIANYGFNLGARFAFN